MQAASTNEDKSTNTLASPHTGLPTDPLQSRLDLLATALSDFHQQQQPPPTTTTATSITTTTTNNNNNSFDWLTSNDPLPLSHPSDLLADSSAPLNVPEPDQFDDDLERALAGIETSQFNYFNTYQPPLEQQFATNQGAGGVLGTGTGQNANAFNANATPFGTNAFGTSGPFGPLFGFGSFTHYGGYGGPGSVVTVSSESAYGGGIADDAQSESYYNPYSPQGSLVNAANPSQFNNSNLFQALENFSNELAAFGLSDTNINSNPNNTTGGGSISGLEGIVPSQTRLPANSESLVAAAAANPNPTTIQPPLLSLDLLMPSSTASGHSFTSSFDDTMNDNTHSNEHRDGDDALELEREFGTSTGLLINGYVPVPPQSAVDPRKKYQCPSCPRAFARAFNLKTHMATHDPNRLKPHICHHPNCGRSFSRKHDLGRHLVSIHKDESGLKLSRADGGEDGQNVGSGTVARSGIRSGSSTYGVSGHPFPPVNAHSGRIHHVGKPSIGNADGKKSSTNTKGATTPTTTNFMPNIALGSISNEMSSKRTFESNPSSRHNIISNPDPLHEFLTAPDPLSKLLNAHDTRHKQFSAQDLKLSTRDLDVFGGSFIKSGPSNPKGFGIVSPPFNGGSGGAGAGNRGTGTHTPRAGSSYSATGSGIDGGLGVAAPGVSRGWCDTCGQGWVGTGRSCRCGGELESKIKLTT